MRTLSAREVKMTALLRRARCPPRRRATGTSGSSPACCRLRDPARQDLRLTRNRRLDALDAAASGLIALSNASGPSSSPPVIWPRSAILQRAAASMVEGMLGRYRLDRRENRDLWRAKPRAREKIDSVLNDVALRQRGPARCSPPHR